MVQPSSTRDAGTRSYDKSPAKSLIYQTNSLPPEFVKQKQYGHSIPFATFDDTEIEKYPSTFVMRKRADGCPNKIGANRDFDPEIYRKQIRENRVSKVEGPRRAYVGAGNILCHPDGSAPHSSMAPPPSHASLGSANCTNDVFHSAYAADASSECP